MRILNLSSFIIKKNLQNVFHNNKSFSFNFFSFRCFSYEDTLEYKLKGRKSLVMVIHPVLKKKPYNEIICDAEEALGLARSAKLDILPGPTMPKCGWDEEELSEIQYIKELKQLNRFTFPSSWHLDKGDESDEEYDIKDEIWMSETLRRQFAESTIIKIRQPNSNYLFGSGKVKELAYVYSEQPCDFVFINTLLSPLQHRNLEEIFNNALQVCKKNYYNKHFLKRPSQMINNKISNDINFSDNSYEEDVCLPASIEVIDRHRIVLEIFSLKARNKHAQLQVDLARLAYMRNGLSAGCKSRHKQMMKFFCSEVANKSTQGDKWIEEVTMEYVPSDESYEQFERRILDQVRKKIRLHLQQIKKCKELQRNGRMGKTTIALVGYTNVGKSMLVNSLCNSNLKVRDLLFETLDNNFNQLKLPSGASAIIIDSVGFIQNLPHSLYQAFQSTLEEIKEADIILHVRDISHPQTELHKKVVLDTLKDTLEVDNLSEEDFLQISDDSEKVKNDGISFSLKKNNSVCTIEFSKKKNFLNRENTDTLISNEKNCDIAMNNGNQKVSYQEISAQKHKAETDHIYKNGNRDYDRNNDNFYADTENTCENKKLKKRNQRIIEVWNKFDLLEKKKLQEIFEVMPKNAIFTSALHKTGCDLLLQIIDGIIMDKTKKARKTLKFSTKDAKKHLDFLRKNCELDNESIKTNPDGSFIYVEAYLNESILNKYFKFIHSQ